jgi:hypothetical protein
MENKVGRKEKFRVWIKGLPGCTEARKSCAGSLGSHGSSQGDDTRQVVAKSRMESDAGP